MRKVVFSLSFTAYPSNWARRHPDRLIDGMASSLDWLIDREALGLPDKMPPAGYLEEGPIAENEKLHFGPQPGRYAVFVCQRQNSDRRFEYFLEFEPVEILGYTVYTYI